MTGRWKRGWPSPMTSCFSTAGRARSPSAGAANPLRPLPVTSRDLATSHRRSASQRQSRRYRSGGKKKKKTAAVWQKASPGSWRCNFSTARYLPTRFFHPATCLLPAMTLISRSFDATSPSLLQRRRSSAPFRPRCHSLPVAQSKFTLFHASICTPYKKTKTEEEEGSPDTARHLRRMRVTNSHARLLSADTFVDLIRRVLSRRDIITRRFA